MDKYKQALDPLLEASKEDIIMKNFFNPETVALVGATEQPNKPGRALMGNLLAGCTVYPINIKRDEIMGRKCYKSLKDCPTVPSLVCLCVPAKFCSAVVGECVDLGITSIVIISGGFREIGQVGQEYEDAIMAHIARSEGKTRIIGPNCVGVMCPGNMLNATFCTQMANDGNIAYIAQSGAMITSVLDWTMQTGVGFSHFIAVGTQIDISWAELLYFCGNDDKTKSILLYMESIGDAQSFLRAAREVSLQKPIIVLKSGRSEGAAKAAISHTGSLAGSDEVLNEAFRRAGVVRVNTISELFGLAEVLSRQPLPKGPNLTIVSHAGGPGVLAADALEMTGGKLTELTDETMEKLNKELPDTWSHGNPIDMVGDADADRYMRTLSVVKNDPNTDAIFVIMVPVAVCSPVQVAQVVILFQHQTDKPILACFMGGEEMAPARAMMERNSIPVFPFADDAVVMFNYMWGFKQNLISLHSPVSTVTDDVKATESLKKVKQLLDEWQAKSDDDILPEADSKLILGAYGIPIAETVICPTKEEAVAAATKMGYPVVIKIHSTTITHKSDCGGVILNVKDDAAVTKAYDDIAANVTNYIKLKDLKPVTLATHFLGVTVQPMLDVASSYELLLGSSSDMQFGPVIVFGTGGELVEVVEDTSLALPPLNENLVERMFNSVKVTKALKGWRGRKAVDLDELKGIIIRFSRLVSEHQRIKEIDINPILASGERIIAVDARVVLWPKSEDLEKLPPLAIRPYPTQYNNELTLKDGRKVMMRMTRPEDEESIKEFHKRLSDDAVLAYFRKPLSYEERTDHLRMIKVLHADYNTSLNAAIVDQETKKFLAVGRCVRVGQSLDGNFTLLVAEAGAGLGNLLTTGMLEILKKEGYKNVFFKAAKDLPFADVSLHMMKKSNFRVEEHENEYVGYGSLDDVKYKLYKF